MKDAERDGGLCFNQQGAMAARLTAAERALEAQADGARDTDQAVGYLQRQLAEHRAQHMRLAEDLARVRAALGFSGERGLTSAGTPTRCAVREHVYSRMSSGLALRPVSPCKSKSTAL